MVEPETGSLDITAAVRDVLQPSEQEIWRENRTIPQSGPQRARGGRARSRPVALLVGWREGRTHGRIRVGQHVVCSRGFIVVLWARACGRASATEEGPEKFPTIQGTYSGQPD